MYWRAHEIHVLVSLVSFSADCFCACLRWVQRTHRLVVLICHLLSYNDDWCRCMSQSDKIPMRNISPNNQHKWRTRKNLSGDFFVRGFVRSPSAPLLRPKIWIFNVISMLWRCSRTIQAMSNNLKYEIMSRIDFFQFCVYRARLSRRDGLVGFFDFHFFFSRQRHFDIYMWIVVIYSG